MGVRHARGLEAEILLEGADGLPGAFPVAAGKLPRIVLHFLQAGLQSLDVVSVVPVFQNPDILRFDLQIVPGLLQIHGHRFGVRVSGLPFSVVPGLFYGRRFGFRFSVLPGPFQRHRLGRRFLGFSRRLERRYEEQGRQNQGAERAEGSAKDFIDTLVHAE